MGYSAAPGAVISVSVEGVAASQRQIDNMAQSMNNLSQTVQNAMRNLAATVGLGGGMVEIANLSDQYTKLTSQLRLATGSTSEYAAAYADVRRIAHEAQAELASTGVLYARIANGTQELGISQKRLADITEVVNLSLKVSAATTEEAASAQLQLSQAFAAGALRGEDFNAVNEAAPRLMRALAEGMGVPVGALKQMASEGKITSQVMADVLPRSLEELRQEASQVQTIGGAFTNLKNQVLEFTGTTAQSNGTVALMTGGIGLLANNLNLVAGALTTVTAVKAANWAQAWTVETYRKIAADQAARTAALAATEADLARVQATGAQATATQAAIGIAREEMTARLAQANSNIAAAEATISAASAAGVQTFALRTLRIATADLAEAEVARGLALAELATLGQQQVRVSAEIAAARVAEAAATRALGGAQAGAALGAGMASRALGLLGGPIGAVVTVLGVAATAWSVYSSKSQDANQKAAESTTTSTIDIVDSLERQNAKLRERLSLQQQVGVTPQDSSPAADRMASVLAQINALSAKGNELKEKGQELDQADQAQLYALGLEYNNLTRAMGENRAIKAQLDATGKAATDLIAVRERLAGIDKQYFEDLNTLQTAREKGAIGEREYISLVSQLATAEYKKSDAGKAALEAEQKQKEAYTHLSTTINEKIAANRLELATGLNVTEGQKLAIQLDQELASGKIKLAAAQQQMLRALLATLGALEQENRLADAQRELNKWIIASTDARDQAAASLQVEYSLYGMSADARDIAMVKVRAEADAQKKLDEMRAAGKPITEQMINRLNAETNARVLVEQATLAQGKALQYAAQLADENKRFGLEYIADDRQRAAAQLDIDAAMWRERIRLAGDGTNAQKILQQQYDTWYQNQSLKPDLDAQKRLWDGIDQSAHDTFLSIQNGAASAAERARNALKNGLFEWLYQMAARPVVLNLQASLGMGGVAQAATPMAAGGTASSNPLLSAASAASGLYKMVSGGFAGVGSTIGQGLSYAGNTLGSNAVYSFGQGMQGFSAGGIGSGIDPAMASYGNMAGTAAGWGAGMLGGHYLGNAISGDYSIGNNGQAVTNVASAIGLILGAGSPLGAVIGGAIGGLLNRAFGMGSTQVQAQGLRGTLTDATLTGGSYQDLHQNGGWFRSDKNWEQTTPFDTATVSQLTKGLSAIESASSGFAASLGLSADAIAGYSKTFDLALTNDTTKNQQLLVDLMNGIGDELARKLVPNLDSFSKSGESAAATLERLSGEFNATSQVAQLLGTSAAAMFGTVGLDSAAARERLIDLAGGISNLGSEASFFNQNFLSDAERIKPVAEALDAALASLGLDTIPTTRDEFKSLVTSLIDSGAAATEAGAQELNSLLSLAQAFAQVHPAAAAAAAAVTSAANAFQSMKDSANTAYSDIDRAFSVLQSVVQREKAALQSRIDVEVAAVNKLKSLSDSLHSTLDGMRIPEQAVYDRMAAQAQIKTALAIARAGGPLPAADSLKQALGTVAQNSTSQFETYADYLRDAYSTQNDIADLTKFSDTQLSVEQQSLDALQQQSKSLDDVLANAQAEIELAKGQSTTQLSMLQALEAIHAAIVAASANPIVAATPAINKAYQTALGRSPDSGGLEYWQQQAAAGMSIADITKGITGSAEATIRGGYQLMLGRDPDAAGMRYWIDQVNAGASLAGVMDAIANSDEAKKLHPFAVGTNFVPETMPALIHQGERIIPAADNRALMARLASPAENNAALLTEIKALRAEVSQLRADNSAENLAIAKHSMQAANALDDAVSGNRPLTTKAGT